MYRLQQDGQLVGSLGPAQPSAPERRVLPFWRGRAGIAAVTASGAAVGGVAALAMLRDAGLHAAAVQVATGSAAAVVTVLAAYLLLRRMRRTGAAVDVTLTATVTLLAATTTVLAVLPAITGMSHDDPARLVISGGAGVVVAGGFALAAVSALRVVPTFDVTAERLLMYGVCAALALIGIIATAVGSTGAVTADGTAAPSLVALGIAAAALSAVAAVGFVRRAAATPDPVMLWLGVATAISAVAHLSDAALPWTPAEMSGGAIVQGAGWLALLVAGLRDLEWAHLRRTQDAVVDERRRLARDLHDGLAQELAFIASQATNSHLAEAAERALEEGRAAILQLSRPADEPLERAIADTAHAMADRAGIDVTVAVRPGLDVPLDVRQALLRILREGMGNAIRHGRARHVRISLDGPGPLVLIVADDGAGFDLTGSRRADSLGLVSMRDRAENLGGRLHLDSTPGQGTTLAVVLP